MLFVSCFFVQQTPAPSQFCFHLDGDSVAWHRWMPHSLVFCLNFFSKTQTEIDVVSCQALYPAAAADCLCLRSVLRPVLPVQSVLYVAARSSLCSPAISALRRSASLLPAMLLLALRRSILQLKNHSPRKPLQPTRLPHSSNYCTTTC